MISVIPAIDLMNGKCVRLSQGDFNRKTAYSECLAALALKFYNAGIKRIHMVDLDGAKLGRVKNLDVLQEFSRNYNFQIDFGGGVSTEALFNSVLEAGAFMVSIGSMAVTNKNELLKWINEYGPAKILLGADVWNEKIAINGWRDQTGIPVLDFIGTYLDHGITGFFCTDISKDGMLEGPAFDLYEKILYKYPLINLTASGGIRNMEDIYELDKMGCNGVIVGKALYEGNIQINEISEFNRNAC